VLWTTANTPSAIIARLHDAVVSEMNMEKFREALEQQMAQQSAMMSDAAHQLFP
jgi:tripartite-type tricarboxylate transporter receptor subunit TctC